MLTGAVAQDIALGEVWAGGRRAVGVAVYTVEAIATIDNFGGRRRLS